MGSLQAGVGCGEPPVSRLQPEPFPTVASPPRPRYTRDKRERLVSRSSCFGWSPLIRWLAAADHGGLQLHKLSIHVV